MGQGAFRRVLGQISAASFAAAVVATSIVPALAGGVVATAATPAGSFIEGGTVVLEASSAHLSVQLYWDDAERQRTSFRYLTILPVAINKDQVLWRVLVDEQQGVGKIVARGEAEASWEKKAGLPSGGTPESTLQYAITIAPERLPLVVDEMERLASESGNDRSLSGYAEFGVATLTRVLRAADFRQQVASDQIVELFPDPNDYGATPLSWLYGLMQRNSGGPGGQLDGCETRAGHFLSPKDLEGGFLDKLGPALGTTTAARVLSIVKLYDGLAEYIDKNDVAADLLPFLQFDPVLVDIYDCQMLQSMRGNDSMPDSIVGRSQIYRAFDDYLTESNTPKEKRVKPFPNGEAPRFFRAAYLVTRPLGVSFIDMFERDPRGLLRQVWDPLFDVGQIAGVITLTEDPEPPSELARTVLREINVELFKMNRTIMRRLFGRTGRMFDPLDTDNPATKGYSKAISFDLRMVIAEQTTVERYLRAAGLKSNSHLMELLTIYSRILPALNMERVFGPGSGKRWEHLKQIRDVYAAVTNASIDSGFADFKYRVAIGSAYVFILHGLDPSTELGPYLNKLWPTLRQRPTDAEARALDEQVRALRDSAGLLPRADGNKSAAAQLQRGVLAFLSATAASDQWLDCSPNIDVLAKPASLQSPPGPIQARLSFLAAHGPGAAIPAFELLPQGGAIDGAARPPTLLSENACASIHARRAALECALTATSPDGCKNEFASSVYARSGNKDTVFLIEESIATKAYAAQLGGFFSSEIGAGTPPNEIVEAARLEANDYARSVAIFSALDAASERALTSFGPGITPEDLVPARAVFASKTGTVGVQGDSEFSVDVAALEQLNDELTSSRLAATIDQRRAALAPIIAKLDAYYSPDAPIELLDLSDEPVVSSATSVTAEILSLTPAALTETAVNLESRLAEAGIELQILPTGNSTAGVPLFDVGVAYRMPLSGGAAGCKREADTSCIGGAEEIVPLGIKVHRVAKTASGALRTTAPKGEQDTDLDGAVAGAALHSLGMPSIFEVQGIGIRGSPDFSSLTLEFGFDVGGLSETGLELPILREGAAADIRGALETEVRKRIEATDLASRLDSLRLPTFGTRGTGLWLAPDAAGASISLDWPGQALVASIGYRLGYGAEDAVQLLAKAELLATTRGFEIRQMSFSSEGADAFTKRLLKETGIGDALTGKLGNPSIVPEYANSTLALAVSGNFTIETCTVAIVARVSAGELDQPDAVVKRILSSGEQTARDVANCVIHKALDGLQQLLAKKSLTLFGLMLAIDNTDALADEYAANPSVGELRPVLKLDDTRECVIPGPASGSITGAVIRLADGDPRIDLSGIARSDEETKLLGRAVECRLRSLIAPGAHLDFQDYQISGDVFSAVVNIRDLPWLGDLSLGRINLSAVGTEDPEKILTDAVGAALEARVGEEIGRRLAGAVPMPGIGNFELLADGTRVILFGADARIELRGQVDIQSIKAKATLTIPFKGLPASARVDLELGQTLQDSVLGAIADLLPFGGEQVQVSAPKLERLDAGGRRFGLVFGITANFAMDPSPGFKVEIRRIIVTDEGIRLGGQIRLRLGYDLEFVYFAITDITVVYDTGEGGAHKGVILQASVAPLASILKYIIKLEGDLDLRELGSKRFTLNAALILLNSLDLMLATGTVDLDKTAITFEAKTSPAVAEVLDIHGSGKLLGDQGIATADAVMGILGEKLSESEMFACSKPCNGLPAPQMLRVRVRQNLLGEASLLGTTDFELNDPRIGGRIDLNLLGWRPGSATIDASLASAVVSLRFIGIGVTVITPSIKTMTPQLLIDILKSLLDIDLESLLKMKLEDVTVSLMHGDGSVTTYQPGSPGADNGPKPGGGDGRNKAPNPGTSAPKQYNASAPDPGEARQPMEPQFPGVNELFGEHKVEAIYCEKVFGTGESWPANDGDRFEFWVYETRDPAPRLYSGHTHQDPSEVTWHNWTFDAASAREICGKVVHTVHELEWERFPRVGVGRQISTDYDECTENVPSIGLWGLVGNDLNDKAKYVTSYKPVLCWESDGERYDLRIRLLRADQYLGLVECVAPSVAPQWLERDPLFKRACREHLGLLRLGQLDGVNNGLLTASQEFALLDIRARHQLTTGQDQYPDLKQSFQVPLAAGAIDVTVYPVFDRQGAETGSRILMQGPDGKTLAATLPTSHPLNDWLAEEGFKQEIIAEWFVRGRRPGVDYSKDRTDLVLAIGGLARAWLFRDDPAAPTITRRDLILEGAALGDETLEDFLSALAPEVRLLTEGPWQASLGIAKGSDIRLYVLRNDADQAIRILLDLYNRPSESDREPGDFSTVERKARRHCQSVPVLAAAMSDRLGTAVAGRSLAEILAAPDNVLPLGPVVHPLLVVREQPACP